ncbi:hypothetical protein [uncultured Sphingomonas sp.]|uniref:hypothetical protein n=1 Tax=uncultured Sphingomonas sp. TaxID=158754 RepID=UPI0025E765FC|nr:hypothetical protein [uncultured Sphingomonas sp.]
MTAWMLWAAAAILQAGEATAPMPDAVSADTRTLEAIGDTGATIFAFDKAAWVSTDALMEVVPKDQLTGAGGYVIEPLGGGVLRATYFRGPAISAQAFFVADVKGGKVTRRELLTQPVPLTPDQMLLARAREIAKDTAQARHYQPCTPAPFNTVVVPMRPGGPVAVYLLTAQVTNKSYMMGGNYRVVIAPDGHVTSVRPFNVSCLAQTKPKLPKGAEPVGMVVNHLLDPTPTEIHVFTSYSMGSPLFVATEDKTTGQKTAWLVQGRRISALPQAK